MNEPGKRINYSNDYVIHMQCGCRVTFLGSAMHRSRQLDACSNHDGLSQSNERTRIMENAITEYEHAELMQPPR